MSDIAFRTASKPQAEKPAPAGKTKQAISSDTEVEPPFTSYHQINGQPYIVDLLNIGEYWNDPDGGFEQEIGNINGFLQQKIERGEIADTLQSVKNEIKAMEKINKLKGEERMVVKLGTLSAYAKFLTEKDSIRKTYMKYGH